MVRVLVVDDDRSSRFAITAILQHAGYETVEADSGLAALDILRHDPNFAGIVSDMPMPKMDGLRLLEQVRRFYPAIPVVIVSGLAGPGVEARARGAAYYLPKPFSQHQLVSAVRLATQAVAP